VGIRATRLSCRFRYLGINAFNRKRERYLFSTIVLVAGSNILVETDTNHDMDIGPETGFLTFRSIIIFTLISRVN